MMNFLRQSGASGKKQRFLLFAWYFALLIVAVSLACRPKAPAEGDANAPEPDAAQAPVDSVVVTINGADIMQSSVDELVQAQFQRMAARTSQLPPAFAEQLKSQLRQQTLDRLIVERLLDGQADKSGIEISDERVTEKLTEMAAQQKPPLSLEDLKARIEGSGRDFEELRHEIRKGLRYEQLFQAEWAGKIDITDDQVSKYYSENPKEFETPEQIRASHILIKPDPNTDPNEAKATAKAKAQDLLKQIKDGADFAELAKAHSGCTSSANGGDLGFFGRGQMVPPFEQAAFELQPGQISDVVETEVGYHIVKVAERKDSSVVPLEQAKDGILEKLRDRKKGEIAEAYVKSLKEAASIVYPPGQESTPNVPALPNPDGGS
ncbi:MAG: peptidylprolyl isomerase [Phycisphaerales bacterium]|nr:MAG: peptidylprolyl isomerase [Phycisphaerales bacterium]